MSLDTLNHNGYYFVTDKDRRSLKYDIILQSLYIKPGSMYSVTNTEQTQKHLMGLKVYRLVNIFFSEPEIKDPGMLLDCHIQLTILDQQSYRVELEGTNSAGNFGGALNLIYQHKICFMAQNNSILS